MTANITDPVIPAKTTQLRQLLQSDGLAFLLEAHNGVSARIVEQSGFSGIWASGLAISAQFGVRDSNEASWTQVVDMLEFMSDVTSIPILLDGDTGYGNFNNMRRLVRKLEQRNIAGVCIEDKQFPKTNSFLNGERQALADIDEFCGKLKAGKDSQLDDDFCIVARIEALIAGWGMQEALKRAAAYHRAGADALLIHSKKSRADEIMEFAAEWDNRCPLVIVPTKYYSTPVEVFRNAGISTVIWANHMIRAAIAAMESVSEQIKQDESVLNIEHKIASVERVFQLQCAEELDLANERYLMGNRQTSAVILAASRGNALRELTRDRPKVMIKVGGTPVLQRLIDEFKRHKVNEITVVAGYKSETIPSSGIKVVVNGDYQDTGELVSLACALESFRDDMVILYGDLLFRGYILEDLLQSEGEIVVVVDSVLTDWQVSGMPDFAYCSSEDDRSIFHQDIELQSISEQQAHDNNTPSGRWIGMLRLRAQGRSWVETAIQELQQTGGFKSLTIPDLLNHLIKNDYPVKVHYINGHWLDINELGDIERAGDFIEGHTHD